MFLSRNHSRQLCWPVGPQAWSSFLYNPPLPAMGPWLRETKAEVPKAKGSCITSLIAVFSKQCSGKFLLPYTFGSPCLAWFRRDPHAPGEAGCGFQRSSSQGDFLSLKKIKKNFFKVLFDCSGALLLHTGFSGSGKRGLRSSFGAQASHCSGFACCEHRFQGVWAQ